MIDLRSDTVTRPVPGMREAMARAEVGDDVFADDPTVLALQERVAAMFGHEDSLFTPTGSMANQLALQLLVPRGEEALCEVNSHITAYEGGAAAAIGGISTRTYSSYHEIPAMIRPSGGYVVGTRAIAVEQTHNAGGGTVTPMSTLEKLRAVANSAGVALHCDGARIWHAHVATGISLQAYGKLFDTVSVCLSKGLGAPVGSLLIGSAEKMRQARLLRKRMGGGMRQVGVLAAAGLYALDHHLDRLAEDHVKASRLAKALEPWARWGGTNIIYLDNVDAPALVAQARGKGVLLGASGPREARLITHLDVDDAAVDRAGEILLTLLDVR